MVIPDEIEELYLLICRIEGAAERKMRLTDDPEQSRWRKALLGARDARDALFPLAQQAAQQRRETRAAPAAEIILLEETTVSDDYQRDPRYGDDNEILALPANPIYEEQRKAREAQEQKEKELQLATLLDIKRACGCWMQFRITIDDQKRPTRTLFDAERDELVRTLSHTPCGLHPPGPPPTKCDICGVMSQTLWPGSACSSQCNGRMRAVPQEEVMSGISRTPDSRSDRG